VRADVSKRSDVESLARRAFGTFGQVHLLFNNAGVADATFDAIEKEQFYILSHPD
jgi:NAD(P)-dependent dehydrogenase (short-subunit alcohol dehydrogenase family)